MNEKKTKIICTVSDDNCSVEFLKALYENGMNVVRLNSAHATIEGAQKVVDNVRKVSDKIAILIDTKGNHYHLFALARISADTIGDSRSSIKRFDNSLIDELVFIGDNLRDKCT